MSRGYLVTLFYMSRDLLVKVLGSIFGPHDPALEITAIVGGFSVLLFALLILYSRKEHNSPPPAGCGKLGIKGRSNLHDQYSKKFDKGATDTNAWKVKALFIYPIKSCAGLELDTADVIRSGFRYDRQFAFAQKVTPIPKPDGKIEGDGWKFITQRTHPHLVNVKIQVWIPDLEAPDYDPGNEWVKNGGCLVIRFPFSDDVDFSVDGFKALLKKLQARLQGDKEPMLEFRIPFNPTKERIAEKGITKEEMAIWKDKPAALNFGPEIPTEIMAKLKYHLGVSNPLTLFRIDPEGLREVHKCAPKKDEIGWQPVIAMVDSYPLHINSLASIHYVASQLPKKWGIFPQKLTALRYRANIYMTGPPPFTEDHWKKVEIGGLKYHISCRTTRCNLPCVNPETGEVDLKNLNTEMRKFRVIDEGSKAACLGVQSTPLEEGPIRIGDMIKVLETGKHFYLSK